MLESNIDKNEGEGRELGLRRHVQWENGQKLISRARSLPKEQRDVFYQVNKFVKLAHEDFSQFVSEVDQAPSYRCKWRETLGLLDSAHLDLEIGTGNGYYFEYLAREHQDRGLVGIELKYKPLIQTVKRARFTGHKFFKLLRYDAKFLTDIFGPNELNNVYIFFPDPWEKRCQNKHRLITTDFLKKLFVLQRSGSYLKIKTDSQSYYEWIVRHVKESPFKLVAKSEDLHSSEWASGNFQTHFERLWTRKGRKTFFVQLLRDENVT